MCSNIPASTAYGVYISQLIRYARASSNYSDFLKRHLHKGNNKITELRTILQRESQKSSEKQATGPGL
jgi:hypothetical protein